MNILKINNILKENNLKLLPDNFKEILENIDKILNKKNSSKIILDINILTQKDKTNFILLDFILYHNIVFNLGFTKNQIINNKQDIKNINKI